MGIFDDAIREHLDLKRRQGADEEELKQLEDEAFGLPARPGDPDFPETGESQATGEPSSESAPEPEAKQAEAPAEAPAEVPGAGSATDEHAAEPAPRAAEAPSDELDHLEVDPEDEVPPHGDALLEDAEAEPKEPPDEGPVEDTAAPSFSTSEREAIAGQPTEFFEQTPEPIELGELDLDRKEELDDVGGPEEGEPATGEEEPPATAEQEVADPAAADPTPVDEIEVVEHTEPAADEQSQEAGAEDEAEKGEGEDAEDVLEETPEFLRDNPDDDELWFEQGEPKDFDF
jgi:hypothetical protein